MSTTNTSDVTGEDASPDDVRNNDDVINERPIPQAANNLSSFDIDANVDDIDTNVDDADSTSSNKINSADDINNVNNDSNEDRIMILKYPMMWV